MTFLQQASLKNKVIMIIMLTTIMAITLMSISLIVIDQNTARDSIAKRLDILTRVIAERSTAAIRFDDQETARLLLSALREDRAVVVACVYTASDQPFAIYGRNDESECRSDLKDSSVVFEDRHLHLSQTIKLHGSKIGTLYLTANLKEIHERLFWFALTIFLICIIVTAAAFYIASKLQKAVTRPLTRLRDVAEKIADTPDYSHQLPDEPDHEINSLYTSFSKMLEQIKHRNELREQAERSLRNFEHIVSNITDPIALLDKNFTYIVANSAYQQLMGKSPEQILHQNAAQVFGPEFFQNVIKPNAMRCLKGENVNYQDWFDFAGNRKLYMDITYFPYIDSHAQIEGFIVHARDITQKKNTEEALQSSEERFRAIYDENPIMLFTINEAGRIITVNQYGLDQLGYTRKELVNQPALKLFHEDHRLLAEQYIKQCFAKPDEVHNCEMQKIRKDGSSIYVHETVRIVDGSAGEPVALFVCEDITKRKQTDELLTYQASHDTLTGLINRLEFERRTERLLSDVKPEQQHAMCYLDLDQFKVVNDTCGHTAGDEMLRQLSSRLTTVVRHRDTLARLGGDEFGVLMEHCSLDDAQRVASSLLSCIQDFQFIWEDRSFKVGVSIGLVPISQETSNLTELLKDADAACYMAKDLGRNRIHVYHAEDKEIVQRQGEMQWVAKIHEALEEDRFTLYAQIIHQLDNSDDNHYELLIRMRDDTDGTIPPGAFLPAAERYNLITGIDKWVIHNAFHLLSENPNFLSNTSFCSINISGQSLTEDQFLSYVIEELHNSGIDGRKICFEITETAAITSLNNAIRFISTLKGLGCQFALDDFGSGLSSFAYLKNLPVDYLKIDGVFVKDIAEDPIDRAMVKSINEIGHLMGMQTIAEFVENDVIKGILIEIGVDYAQGYGVGKPVPFESLLNIQ